MFCLNDLCFVVMHGLLLGRVVKTSLTSLSLVCSMACLPVFECIVSCVSSLQAAAESGFVRIM